jgi:hypothetical protein
MPHLLVVLRRRTSGDLFVLLLHAPTSPGRADSLPLVVGLVPLVVGVAFLPPSGLAVMLRCLSVVKHLGDVGRFALGAGGPLVRSSGALMRPTPTLDLLVMLALAVAGHRMSLPAGRPLTTGAASG